MVSKRTAVCQEVIEGIGRFGTGMGINNGRSGSAKTTVCAGQNEASEISPISPAKLMDKIQIQSDNENRVLFLVTLLTLFLNALFLLAASFPEILFPVPFAELL